MKNRLRKQFNDYVKYTDGSSMQYTARWMIGFLKSICKKKDKS